MANMITPARLLYDAAGQPPSTKPSRKTTGPCWVCGLPCGGEGVSVDKAVGQNFTDHANVAVPSAIDVCVPCTWALSGRPPHTLRMWTVIYRTDRPMKTGNPKAPSYPSAHLTAKNDFSELRSILLDPPIDGSLWFVSVAESGQKHVVPFAKVNTGNHWEIRVENENLCSDSRSFGRILSLAGYLYKLGFNRNEILTGRVTRLDRLQKWRMTEKYLGPLRDSGILSLAVSLLNKREIDKIVEDTKRFRPTEFGR